MDEGVNFVRGRAAEVSDVALSPEEQGHLVVKAEDTLLGITRRIPVDMVILSAGLSPRKDAKEVAQTFGFGCSANGFYLERHPKLEPASTMTDGIFFAGACQYPKDIPDAVAQAGAAAAGALVFVNHETVKVEPTISYIDPEKCSGCHICVGLCPHSGHPVQRGEERRPRSSRPPARAAAYASRPAVPTCRSRRGYLDEQIFAEIEGALAV